MYYYKPHFLLGNFKNNYATTLGLLWELNEIKDMKLCSLIPAHNNHTTHVSITFSIITVLYIINMVGTTNICRNYYSNKTTS